MQTITRATIASLLDNTTRPTLTIYFPLQDRGKPAIGKENRHAFRLLLQQSEERLIPWLPNPDDTQSFLQQTESLWQDDSIWQNASGTLILCIADGMCLPMWHPDTLPQQVIAGNEWYLLPALPYLMENRDFHLLMLTPKHVRLLQINASDVTEIPIEGYLPETLEDIVGADHAQRMPQAISQHLPKSSATYFGHGEGIDDRKPELTKYLAAIDDGLCRLFPEPTMPLVVAADHRLFDQLANRSHFQWLWPECVSGNPMKSPEEDIIHAAKELLHTHVHQRRYAAMEQYLEGLDRHRMSNDLTHIGQAAVAGKIQSLFVDEGARETGVLHATTGVIDFAEDSPQADDLLNLLALTTWQQGGDVFVVARGTFQDLSPVHALYRYA